MDDNIFVRLICRQRPLQNHAPELPNNIQQFQIIMLHTVHDMKLGTVSPQFWTYAFTAAQAKHTRCNSSFLPASHLFAQALLYY